MARQKGLWYGADKQAKVNQMRVKELLAVKVRKLREERGWNQIELAWQAGISAATVNRVENVAGSLIPMANTVLRIAMALEVSMDWLLGYKSKSKSLMAI